MKLQTVIEAGQFKITEGSAYCWGCFGMSAHLLDMAEIPGDLSCNTVSVVFDRISQRVYEVTIFDTADNAFRWIDSDYVDDVKNEYVERGLDFNIAFDNVKYVNITDENVIVDVVSAAVNGESLNEFFDFDGATSTISIDISDADLALIARAAHLQDITINQFFINVMKELIK